MTNNVDKRSVSTDALIGTQIPTKQGDTVIVLSKADNYYFYVTFKHDNTPENFSIKARKDHILSGNVKNPYYPSVFGVGYLGTTYKQNRLKSSSFYFSWVRMLERCYCQKLKNKYPTYNSVTCAPEWLNLSNYKSWFDIHYKEGYELDKDLLIKNNKIYSPDTCCFIPPDLNKLLTKANAIRGKYPIGVQYHKRSNKFTSQVNNGSGKLEQLGYFDTIEDAFNAYKIRKEAIIKELAAMYYNKQQISQAVYTALIDYEVNIND